MPSKLVPHPPRMVAAATFLLTVFSWLAPAAAEPTSPPPYYAVIFTSTLVPDATGYADMAQTMEELAARQPGYLGIESAREEIGVSVGGAT